MTPLLGLSRGIDAVTAFVGRWIYWLILGAVLVSAGNAIIRKLFDMSSNAWLELQWYLFGAVFMLAAAYTLQRNEHIRIDIISNMLSQKARNWIDIVGHLLFLLPFCALMIYELYPWVRTASPARCPAPRVDPVAAAALPADRLRCCSSRASPS
jgi:TRAP-type mannitol/chloroaromatic compound transport system permease small subunit